MGRRVGRASKHSVRHAADDRSRFDAEPRARSPGTRAGARSADRILARGARRARRAARFAAAGLLENRRPARLHEPAASARALLRPVGGRRLRARRADDRGRRARSAAGRRVLHARSGGRSADLHAAHELSHVSRVGEHAERSRNHRPQQHRRRRRQRDAAARQLRCGSPHAASRSLGRMVRDLGGRPGAVHPARARRQHHVLGAREHVEPGVRRLDDQLARVARLSLAVQRHRRAAGVRSPDARDQPVDAPGLGSAG